MRACGAVRSAQHLTESVICQAGALALLGHFVYFWTLGVLSSIVDWLVHREQPSDAPADKPVQAAMRRCSSRTQLAGV